MNYLIKEKVENIAKSFGMHWTGSMWAGKTCPWCGLSRSGNEKFNFWVDGGYRCWSPGCKEGRGDFISWLRNPPDGSGGMSCAEAHEFVQAPCLSTNCPYFEKCRITRGGRRAPKKFAGKDQSKSCDERYYLNIVESLIYPHPDWVVTMGALVEKAAKQIFANDDILHWLAERGVTRAMVERNKIGFLSHDESIPISDLGMIKVKKGEYPPHGYVGHGKHKLWVPGGLLFPTISGEIFCFEIRRTKEMRKKYLPNIKYLFVKGGGRGYRSLWRGSAAKRPSAVVVIESYLDAVMVSELCPEVAVIWGKDKPLSKKYADCFRKSPLILTCMDNDQPNKMGIKAGEQKAKVWSSEFENAFFWPVPAGKDPGEYYRDHDGDVRSWIMDGIESFSKKTFLVPPRADQVEQPSEQQDISNSDGDVIEMEIHGQIIYLVRNNQMLQKIAVDDKIVFSQQEFDIISGTFKKLSKEEALKLFEIKKVFGASAMMIFSARLVGERKRSAASLSRAKRNGGAVVGCSQCPSMTPSVQLADFAGCPALSR